MIRGLTSTPSTLHHGVPQGSVLGPLLFLLYTTDIAGIVERTGLSSHMYADDNQDYVHCAAGNIGAAIMKLHLCFAETSQWIFANRLKLNSDKTEVMLFGPRRKHDQCSIDSVDLGGRKGNAVCDCAKSRHHSRS